MCFSQQKSWIFSTPIFENLEKGQIIADYSRPIFRDIGKNIKTYNREFFMAENTGFFKINIGGFGKTFQDQYSRISGIVSQD